MQNTHARNLRMIPTDWHFDTLTAKIKSGWKRVVKNKLTGSLPPPPPLFFPRILRVLFLHSLSCCPDPTIREPGTGYSFLPLHSLCEVTIAWIKRFLRAQKYCSSSKAPIHHSARYHSCHLKCPCDQKINLYFSLDFKTM